MVDGADDDRPKTLGEYRDLVAALCGEQNDAVRFLDKKIAASPKGRDAVAFASDDQMRAILFPMMAGK